MGVTSNGGKVAANGWEVAASRWGCKPGGRDARARAGAAFSLKDFHAKALSLGAMGLDPLREALARI
jgi:hypothetical protein